MRRLTYAPRAFAFIHSSSLNKVIDVSDDIVSGFVDRNDNDLSKANLVLRNVGRKYIRTKEGTQVFNCDDIITIWLQRLPGQPVQVFTGYLDSVPAWQMYPGDCRIEASCTLKRLAYSWFDPGSMFFINFAARNGWAAGVDGNGYSPQTIADNGNDPALGGDGGFGKFLYDFLIEVAGWSSSMLMISEMDPDLPKRAAKLFADQNDKIVNDESELATILKALIGVDLIDEAVRDASGGMPMPKHVEATTKLINKKLKDSGIPINFAIFAAIHRSNYKGDYSNDEPVAAERFGYGLFGMAPMATGINYTNIANTWNADESLLTVADNIYGHRPVELVGNPSLAIELFKRAYSDAMNQKSRKERKRIHDQLEKSDIKASAKMLKDMGLSVIGGDSDVSDDLDLADTYIQAVLNGHQVNQPSESDGQTVPMKMDWDSEELAALLSPAELVRLRKYKSHHKSLAPYLWFLKKNYGETMELIHPTGIHKESLYLAELNSNAGGTGVDGASTEYGPFFEAFSDFKDHEEVSSVTVINEMERNKLHMAKGIVGHEGSGAAMLTTNSIRVVVSNGDADPPTWLGLPKAPDLSDNVNTQAEAQAENRGYTFKQLAQFSTIAALQSKYSFPVDQVESTNLRGNRALMNDVSCLEAAKQFAQGSMRNLMSLPNGRICAYYPDYFGARRGPYWYIREIEIINMGIQISDEPMATHVYVTGDTTGPSSGGEVDVQDRLHSRGVVSVFNVELMNSFMIPGPLTDTSKERARREGQTETKSEAFLNKHGARPLAEEYAIIKNHWFEFLLAWQRFIQQWAAMYDTRVDFAFQPEVMAGGILGFREHGLQMYCKNVRHTFSYESGFTTSATLTSPAGIAGAAGGTPGAIPGMIITGGINTVGGLG